MSTTTAARTVDRAEVDFPVVGYLPHDEPGWRIDWRREGPGIVLTVTLTPILNRGDQVAARTEALRTLRAEVVAWLTAHGAPVGTYGVMWRPAEAASL